MGPRPTPAPQRQRARRHFENHPPRYRDTAENPFSKNAKASGQLHLFVGSIETPALGKSRANLGVRLLVLHLKRISNPNGIASSSPGLRGTSYPGLWVGIPLGFIIGGCWIFAPSRWR